MPALVLVHRPVGAGEEIGGGAAGAAAATPTLMRTPEPGVERVAEAGDQVGGVRAR